MYFIYFEVIVGEWEEPVCNSILQAVFCLSVLNMLIHFAFLLILLVKPMLWTAFLMYVSQYPPIFTFIIFWHSILRKWLEI